MAKKISVILKCQIDNGKEKKLPGETVSMDEKEAVKLAEMGMVELPAKGGKSAKAADTKAIKTGGENTPPASPAPDGDTPNPDDLDPDALDQGAAGNVTE